VDNSRYIIVFVTAKDSKEAGKIAGQIIAKKLAACVSIISNIKSVYLWKQKVERTTESLLLIKTRKAVFGKLKKEIKKLHSYEVPEIIALGIAQGEAKYLNWIRQSVP